MKTILSAIALTAAATSAFAGTYRVDIQPAEGVVFAPFGAGVALETGMVSEGAVKLQAIDGKPVDKRDGHNNSWFIIEAEEGETVLFTAMQGNSIDTIGQAAIIIPSATPNADTVEIVQDVVMVHSDAGMTTEVRKDREVRTPNADTPAVRVSGADILGWDAGADEGRDTLEAVGSLGTVKVTRLSK